MSILYLIIPFDVSVGVNILCGILKGTFEIPLIFHAF